MASANVLKQTTFKDKDKPSEVRKSNVGAAKAVADAIRSSLGPKGMDKMIVLADGSTVISNDGATILKHMSVLHPCAKMLVELSAAQDVEAGDGTTSVVVLAGSLLSAAEQLLEKGIHPTQIAESFQLAAKTSQSILEQIAIPCDLTNRESLVQSAATSLSSKVVAQHAAQIAPLAVDAVLGVLDPALPTNVDLRDIRVVSKVGGTIDDMSLVEGLVLTQNVNKTANGPSRMEKARIGLIQFQLSAPKTDMDNQIVVNDYRQMDRILKEEREYLLNMCKKIKKSGCNVLLIQKSILRDAVNELSLHFLSKLKIMVINDIERDEIEFVAKSLGCKPIADIAAFSEDKLAFAELIEESTEDGAKIVRVSGVKNPGRTVSIVCRGASKLILEETARSLHDALCVVRCLVKKRAVIAGGGAPEMEISHRLHQVAKTMGGLPSLCMHAYADALDIIPTTLAQNAGLDPMAMVTALRHHHAEGKNNTGISVRKGMIVDMIHEKVIQPLLVTWSAIQLATETVVMILKIDDMVQSR